MGFIKRLAIQHESPLFCTDSNNPARLQAAAEAVGKAEVGTQALNFELREDLQCRWQSSLQVFGAMRARTRQGPI